MRASSGRTPTAAAATRWLHVDDEGVCYLWPSNAWPDWLYVTATNTCSSNGISGDVSNQRAAEFAANTRLPAHLNRFGLDACFFDVVCHRDLQEDYDSNKGHFATRSVDRTNRFGLPMQRGRHRG